MKAIQPSLNFNLRNFTQKESPIYAIVRYSVNGKIVQTKIPTYQKVCPPYWNKKKQLIDMYVPSAILVNNSIMKMRMTFFDYISTHKEISISDLRTIFARITENKEMTNKKPNPRQKTASKLFEKAFEMYYNDAKKSTYDVKKRQLQIIIHFLKEKGDSISKISQSGLNSFQDYLVKKGNNVTYTKNVCALYVCLVNKVLCLKNEFLKYGFQPIKQQYIKDKRTNEDKKIRPLTKEEINKLFSVQGLTKEETFYLDVFNMQLLTGLRFSDITKIFNNDYIVEKFEDLETYKIITQKKSISAIIVANEEIKNLQNKYKNSIKEISIYDYNRHLKRIAKKANLDKEENYINQIGQKIEKQTAKTYKIISSHWARHTFICQKIFEGYDIEQLVKMVGHSDRKMIEKIYGKIGIEKTKARDVIKEFRRVNELNKSQNDTKTTPSNSEIIDKLLEQQSTIIQQQKDIENAQKTIEQQKTQNIISEGFNKEENKNLKEQNERLKQYNEFGLSKEEQKEIEEMFNSDLD